MRFYREFRGTQFVLMEMNLYEVRNPVSCPHVRLLENWVVKYLTSIGFH